MRRRLSHCYCGSLVQPKTESGVSLECGDSSPLSDTKAVLKSGDKSPHSKETPDSQPRNRKDSLDSSCHTRAWRRSMISDEKIASPPWFDVVNWRTPFGRFGWVARRGFAACQRIVALGVSSGPCWGYAEDKKYCLGGHTG